MKQTSNIKIYFIQSVFKKAMLKKTLILFLFTISSSTMFSQSADYSQITRNLLYTNPAFAGTNICPRLFISYRNRFLSLGNAFQTYFLAYDQYSEEIKGDVALTVVHDLQAKGVINNTLIGAVYAKSINLTSKSNLKFAIEVDYFRHKIDNTDLSYPDMIDPVYGFIYNTGETPINKSTNTINFNAGILYHTDNQYAGISLYNINQPTSEYSKKNYLLQRRISAHYARNFTVKTKGTGTRGTFEMTPNIAVANEGKSIHCNYGIHFTKNAFLAGFNFKQNIGTNFDSFTLLLGLIEKRFKFAYNFDVSMINVSDWIIDTHEFSLTLYLDCVDKKKKNKAINCPGI